MNKSKLTKLEKYWILYDVGNSAFILLVSTIIPIYFDAMAEKAGISEVDYLIKTSASNYRSYFRNDCRYREGCRQIIWRAWDAQAFLPILGGYYRSYFRNDCRYEGI